MPSSASNIWVCQLLSHVLTLFDPMNWSPPVSSIHRIFQARILEWVAMPFSKGSSRPRDRTQISHIAGRLFTIWPNREAHLVFTWMYLNVEPTLLQIRLDCFHLQMLSFTCPVSDFSVWAFCCWPIYTVSEDLRQLLFWRLLRKVPWGISLFTPVGIYYKVSICP